MCMVFYIINYFKINKCYTSTDIDPKTPIPPCVMASSAIELQLGYSGFYWPHMRKQTQTNVPMIFACRAVFHACFSSRSDHSTCVPYESRFILIAGNTQIPPIRAPCQDKDGPCSGILVLYLWVHHTCVVFCADIVNKQNSVLIKTHHLQYLSANVSAKLTGSLYTNVMWYKW